MGGPFKTIFNGYGQPSLNFHKEYNLTSGARYWFRLRSYNENGPGEWSDIDEEIVCTDPSGLSAPEIISRTLTSISVEWKPPVFNGGCPIKGYALWVDDGT